MVSPRALNPPVDPGPGHPVVPLNDSRSPFRGPEPPPPHSNAFTASRSGKALTGLVTICNLLAYLDFNETFITHIDASEFQLEAVLDIKANRSLSTV